MVFLFFVFALTLADEMCQSMEQIPDSQNAVMTKNYQKFGISPVTSSLSDNIISILLYLKSSWLDLIIVTHYLFYFEPIPASFSLFFVLSSFQLEFQQVIPRFFGLRPQTNNRNWKKRSWFAWDSNPGPQPGRPKQNHGAMAAAQIC